MKSIPARDRQPHVGLQEGPQGSLYLRRASERWQAGGDRRLPVGVAGAGGRLPTGSDHRPSRPPTDLSLGDLGAELPEASKVWVGRLARGLTVPLPDWVILPPNLQMRSFS